MKKTLLLFTLLIVSITSIAQERSAFSLNLNATPPPSRRIIIGEVGILSENMTLPQLTDYITANLSVYTESEVNTLLLNYLAKNNVTAYTPTQDYHPATKKTVDGGFDNVPWVSVTAGSDMNLFNVRVAQRNGFVTITGRYESISGGFAGKVLFTLPSSIGTPNVPIEFGASNQVTQNNESNQLYIDAGSRDIKLRTNGDDGLEYSFCITYPLF